MGLGPRRATRIGSIEQGGLVVDVGQHSLQRCARLAIHRVLGLGWGHQVESGDVQVELEDGLGVAGETGQVDGYSTARDVTDDHFGRGGIQGDSQCQEEGDEWMTGHIENWTCGLDLSSMSRWEMQRKDRSGW